MRRTVWLLVFRAVAICWWEKPETNRSKTASRRSKPLVRRSFASARALARWEGDAGLLEQSDRPMEFLIRHEFRQTPRVGDGAPAVASRASFAAETFADRPSVGRELYARGPRTSFPQASIASSASSASTRRRPGARRRISPRMLRSRAVEQAPCAGIRSAGPDAIDHAPRAHVAFLLAGGVAPAATRAARIRGRRRFAQDVADDAVVAQRDRRTYASAALRSRQAAARAPRPAGALADSGRLSRDEPLGRRGPDRSCHRRRSRWAMPNCASTPPHSPMRIRAVYVEEALGSIGRTFRGDPPTQPFPGDLQLLFGLFFDRGDFVIGTHGRDDEFVQFQLESESYPDSRVCSYKEDHQEGDYRGPRIDDDAATCRYI